MTPRPKTRWAAALVCLLTALPLVFAPVHAAMVGTEQMLQGEEARWERAQLLQALDREAVREQLSALGVDPDQAAKRVARLSDAEVAELNRRMEEMPAGGSSILGVAAFIFVVFIITDAIGATDIFPFVRPVD
ncbi:DUF6627 family protein [Ectothiorhodospira mobilis]|uniref:DUF6627 family protein n=1 Tax=Ectothiorhodospira mobilis TaxID=195064 RepID=UPI001EE7D8BD|nr:DUF6627 family protein [Ectothiorhodospira mobilis]MCG5534491.1 PA2779 family protein [Ectothiorhodospira mobilis]